MKSVWWRLNHGTEEETENTESSFRALRVFRFSVFQDHSFDAKSMAAHGIASHVAPMEL